MVLESSKKKQFAWRILVYGLLSIVLVIGFKLSAAWLPGASANEVTQVRARMPVHPGPWKEMKRLRSPDDRCDAVLVSSNAGFEDAGQFLAVYVVPKDMKVEEPPPYKSLETFLERMASDAVFAAVQVENFEFSWQKDSKLAIHCKHAVSYTQKGHIEIVSRENDTKGDIEVVYLFGKSRYSDALEIDWGERDKKRTPL